MKHCSDDPDFYKSVFKGRNHPMFWLYSAHRLKFVVEISWPKVLEGFDVHSDALLEEKHELLVTPPNSLSVCEMLMGFCIENQLKAIIILNSEKGADIEAVVKSFSTGHKLADLFEKAQVALPGSDADFIRGLQNAIYTDGRYPVEKTVGLMLKNSDSSVSFDGRTPYEKFIEIYERLKGIALDKMQE